MHVDRHTLLVGISLIRQHSADLLRTKEGQRLARLGELNALTALYDWAQDMDEQAAEERRRELEQ
jgi:hypothetical protein